MAYLLALGLGITGIGVIPAGTAEASMVVATMAAGFMGAAGIMTVFEAGDSRMKVSSMAADSMVASVVEKGSTAEESFTEAEASTAVGAVFMAEADSVEAGTAETANSSSFHT